MSDAVEKAVAVMDRLRSPGGCPWDASQTHQSLARYLIEETYETIEAIETDNMALLREELGDLLFQVLFHARLAEELPGLSGSPSTTSPSDLVDKLVHRHPHVFGSTMSVDADEVNENWERLKVAEKGRTSAVDGVPMSQPALALAGKLVTRAERARLQVAVAGDGIGERLFALAREAVERRRRPRVGPARHHPAFSRGHPRRRGRRDVREHSPRITQGRWDAHPGCGA